jgi:hypothetical protein
VFSVAFASVFIDLDRKFGKQTQKSCKNITVGGLLPQRRILHLKKTQFFGAENI